MELEFSQQIFEKKNAKISNFMKIHTVGAELFPADEHDEANGSFFRNSAKVPRNGRKVYRK
jgi:hypothetical protein